MAASTRALRRIIAQRPGPLRILGIESTCDDTGVAVVSSSRVIEHDALASQWSVHAPHGGVVPLLAARAHRTNLPLLLGAIGALPPSAAEGTAVAAGAIDVSRSGSTPVDAVAVSVGPGLALCLRAGVEAAAEAAAHLDVPLIAVNHLEAHALTPRLFDASIEFPFVTLLVSGGHCTLLLARGVGDYIELGTTLDDSVGEAFDKVARLLRIVPAGEHGGAALERAALRGDPAAAFPDGPLPTPLIKRRDCDFSFSGLKTNVMYAERTRAKREGADAGLDVDERGSEGEGWGGRAGAEPSQFACDAAAAFQLATATHLEQRTARAVQWARELVRPEWRVIDTLVVSGGVAANSFLRERFASLGEDLGLRVAFPPPHLCTDNGAMVAWAAHELVNAGADLRVDRTFPPPPRPKSDAAPLDPDRMNWQTRCPLGERVDATQLAHLRLRSHRWHPTKHRSFI